MKPFLIVVALLIMVVLAAALALPLWAGSALQTHSPGAIGQLDQQVGQYEIRAEPVVKRWLSSDLALTVKAADGRTLFDYPLTVQHGPLNVLTLGISGDGDLLAPSGQALGSLQWRVSAPLKLQAQLTLLPASGVQGQVVLTLSDGGQQWQLSSPGLSGPGMTDLVGSLSGDMANHSGDLQLSIGSASGPNWTASGIRSVGRFAGADGFADIDLNVSAGVTAWPGLAPFSDLTSDLQLQHLDMAVLGKALTLRDNASALALLPALLEQQPVLSKLDLYINHPLGSSSWQLEAQLTEAPPAGFLVDINRLMPLIKADAQWSTSSELYLIQVRRDLMRRGATAAQAEVDAQRQIDNMTAGGWARLNDGRLDSSLSLQQGELRADGQLLRRWP